MASAAGSGNVPRNNLIFLVAALLVAHFGSTAAGLLQAFGPSFELPRYFGLLLFAVSTLTVFVAAGYELSRQQVGGRLIEAALILVVVNLAIGMGQGGLRGFAVRFRSVPGFLGGATVGGSLVALMVWHVSTEFAANLVGLLEEDVAGLRLEYAGVAQDRLTGCRGDLTVYLYNFRSVLTRTVLLGATVAVTFVFARKYASLMPDLTPPDVRWFSERFMTQMALSLVLVSYAYYLRVRRTLLSLGARIDPSVLLTWATLTCVILAGAWAAWAWVHGPESFVLPDVSGLFSWAQMTPKELQEFASRAGEPSLHLEQGLEQGPVARTIGDIIGAVLVAVAVAFGAAVAALMGWIALLVVRDEAEDLKGLPRVLAMAFIEIRAACSSLVRFAIDAARVLWSLLVRGRRYVARRLGGKSGAGAGVATRRRAARLTFDRSPSGRTRRLYYLALRFLARNGARRLPADTPRDFLAAAARMFPEIAEDLTTITDAYVAARYSREGVPREVAEDVLVSYKRLLAQFRRRATPPGEAAEMPPTCGRGCR